MTDEKTVMEDIAKDTLPRKQKVAFLEKDCRVIEYNAIARTLDVDFDGYGIRLQNVNNFKGSTVTIKYKGIIGTPSFSYKI